jgi:hypothetical protein
VVGVEISIVPVGVDGGRRDSIIEGRPLELCCQCVGRPDAGVVEE